MKAGITLTVKGHIEMMYSKTFAVVATVLVVGFTYGGAFAQIPTVPRVDPLSRTSLLLELRTKDRLLGTASGFVVEHGNKRYLISNVHVFSGVDHATGKPMIANGEVPNLVRVWYHGNALETWIPRTTNLRNDDGTPKWIQPNKAIDVAAMPLADVPDNAVVFPFDLKLANANIVATVGMPAFVIGFPAGLTSTGRTEFLRAGSPVPGMPIRKAVHIATDPEINYNGLPVTLVDGTIRGGMSGAPFVVRVTSGYAL